jgi:exodeoxyribonuclease V alpha subunit
LLRDRSDHIDFVETGTVGDPRPAGLETLRADVVKAAADLFRAATAGDASGALDALGRHRLLCAHRRGPYGVARWTTEVERWLVSSIEGYATDGEWYVGRPLLVTTNDYEVQLFNGDTGVVIDGGARGPVAAFTRGAEPLLLGPSRLPGVQTVHVMTVHRGQGSQFRQVTVLLPPPESPLLTRELFYTAITRAEQHVRVVGTAESVQRAVGRPVMRASGLRHR